jgi:hypothetical protein
VEDINRTIINCIELFRDFLTWMILGINEATKGTGKIRLGDVLGEGFESGRIGSFCEQL